MSTKITQITNLSLHLLQTTQIQQLRQFKPTKIDSRTIQLSPDILRLGFFRSIKVLNIPIKINKVTVEIITPNLSVISVSKMLPTRFLQFAASSSSSSVPLTLKVGHVLKQPRRFTEADVLGFSVVSGDRNPIHLDADFSRQIGGFDRGAIVHGMLVASLFPSIIASNFPGAVYTSQTLQFKSPVYIGDEVVAEVEAVTIRAIKDKYYVKWLTKCYIGKDSVIDGEATAILPAITLNKCHD